MLPPTSIAFSSQEAQLEELEKGVQPSWGKLVEPLERITDRLEVIWGMVDHLKAVKDSADLRAAVEEVQVIWELLLTVLDELDMIRIYYTRS